MSPPKIDWNDPRTQAVTDSFVREWTIYYQAMVATTFAYYFPDHLEHDRSGPELETVAGRSFKEIWLCYCGESLEMTQDMHDDLPEETLSEAIEKLLPSHYHDRGSVERLVRLYVGKRLGGNLLLEKLLLTYQNGELVWIARLVNRRTEQQVGELWVDPVTARVTLDLIMKRSGRGCLVALALSAIAISLTIWQLVRS